MCSCLHAFHSHRRYIFKYVPNGRAIVVVRDGRDVLMSLAKRYSDVPNYPMDNLMWRWVNDNLMALHYARDPRTLLIRYEGTITVISGSAQKCDFGFRWSICANYHSAILLLLQRCTVFRCDVFIFRWSALGRTVMPIIQCPSSSSSRCLVNMEFSSRLM